MFQSISSWFQKGDSGPSRKKNTLNSTRDAFSLPTHSPTFNNPPHPSPYSGQMPFNDSFEEPLAGTSSSYTYPPPSSEDLYRYDSSVHYDRGLPGTHKGPLLPVHQTRPLSSSSYPPLSNTWSRIRNWLLEEYAELGDTLNWGCSPELLEQVEAELGYSLPASVRESFSITDGQELESFSGCPDGLFFGLTCLSLEAAFEEWRFWRSVDLDPDTGANPSLQVTMQSIPAGHIRCQYSDPGWFPLMKDSAGNYLGIDMNPGDKGTPGQVIVFGRDFDVKIVLSQGDGDGGWARWLASFAEELEAGETFELGIGSAEESEDSDDGIGYGGYFYEGSGSNMGAGGASGASPGLHLTGDYRGWPVLEAFADRAFHTWQHLGKITTPSTPTPNGAELIQTPPSKEISLIQIPDDSLIDETSAVIIGSKVDSQDILPKELPQELISSPLPQINSDSTMASSSTSGGDSMRSPAFLHQDSSEPNEAATRQEEPGNSSNAVVSQTGNPVNPVEALSSAESEIMTKSHQVEEGMESLITPASQTANESQEDGIPGKQPPSDEAKSDAEVNLSEKREA